MNCHVTSTKNLFNNEIEKTKQIFSTVLYTKKELNIYGFKNSVNSVRFVRVSFYLKY